MKFKKQSNRTESINTINTPTVSTATTTITTTTTTTNTTTTASTYYLLNHWPINNNDVKDYIGSANMNCNGSTSFVADRKNNTNSALFLSGGYCSVPPGIYFYGGDFTILVWVNLQSYTYNTVVLDFGCSPSGDSIVPFLPVGSTQGYLDMLFM